YNRSAYNRHSFLDGDFLGTEPATIGKHFNPRCTGGLEGLVVGGVDVAGDVERNGIGTLDQKKHDGAMSLAHHARELAQMLRAPLRDAVRELRQPGLAHHVDVLDLDVAAALGSAVEQNVDAAVLAVFHFAPQLRVATQVFNDASLNSLGNQRIWPRGVDADEI